MNPLINLFTHNLTRSLRGLAAHNKMSSEFTLCSSLGIIICSCAKLCQSNARRTSRAVGVRLQFIVVPPVVVALISRELAESERETTLRSV